MSSLHSRHSRYSEHTSNEKSEAASFADDSDHDDLDHSLHEQPRDEVNEVEKFSLGDTRRLLCGRVSVAAALLITAMAVALTTYSLEQEQQNSFETAFEQFARTVGDAAIEQQKNIRQGLATLSNELTAHAQSTNKSWPFFTLPLFESFAENYLEQSGAEIITVANYVTRQNREAYVNYANENYEAWVKEGHIIETGILDSLDPAGYHAFLSQVTDSGEFVEDDQRDYYFPSWLFSPPPSNYGLLNWNIASLPEYQPLFSALLQLKNESLVSRVGPYVAAGTAFTQEEHGSMQSKLNGSLTEHPHSFIHYPIYSRIKDFNSSIVGALRSGFAWNASLRNLLPRGVERLYAVIKNNCNQSYTYEIYGEDAFYQGEGDLHNRAYDSMGTMVDLALHTHPNFNTTTGHCQYFMYVYPSEAFEASYKSRGPERFAIVVIATFVLVAIVFVGYDILVERRNKRLIKKAALSNAIVSSLFPGNLRDRIMDESSHHGSERRKKKKKKKTSRMGLSTYEPQEVVVIQHEKPDVSIVQFNSAPIADFFLHATIMFADLVGFTAWASEREPSQVFVLLETVYGAFDEIARQRRVFKVETVGDCYVAAVGVPEPRKDHAVVMCRFARDCLLKMNVVAKHLEVTLGPDTADLTMRIGLHSGSVTGGVLRGERSRFQLFGDTMNTASRIETTGERGRIQVSQETADLLIGANKSHWIIPRENKVAAKGKGEIQTYWLQVSESRNDDDTIKGSLPSVDEELPPMFVQVKPTKNQSKLNDKMFRLIDWNVEQLVRLLKEIVSHRMASPSQEPVTELDTYAEMMRSETPLQEVSDAISLPEFNNQVARNKDHNGIVLPQVVVDQVRDYATALASMYRDNAFHNFDHASHVVMSVTKLMSRIVATHEVTKDLDGLDFDEAQCDADRKMNELQLERKIAAIQHDHTYGINSDPLTHFACSFSALIHDVDHQGVTNAQLVLERASVAGVYDNQSVAEQNAFDLSWNLLMDKRYAAFLGTVAINATELTRFRQLVVNAVMATDLLDENLRARRDERWEKAFAKAIPSGPEMAVVEDVDDDHHRLAHDALREKSNRKATLVIEHMMQAADIAHTMQHWMVYRKWNENLFLELYHAYKEGRGEKNPGEYWYKAELTFFDNTVIPLAQKLKDCGVFGHCGDEQLDYAIKNRHDWEARGEQVVADMVEKSLSQQ